MSIELDIDELAECLQDAEVEIALEKDQIEAVKRFKPDGIMFEKKNKCKTCEVEKPARSKHCNMCKCCV